MRKLFFLLLFITLTSCTDISPKITIENDINLTIDGENIDGLEGQWIITVDEEKDDQDKSVIIIRVTKNEL